MAGRQEVSRAQSERAPVQAATRAVMPWGSMGAAACVAPTSSALAKAIQIRRCLVLACFSSMAQASGTVALVARAVGVITLRLREWGAREGVGRRR